MEDPLSSQKFNIIYVPSLEDKLDTIKETNGNGTIFSLGEDMKCFIPSETKLSLLQRINNNATAWKQLLSTSLGQGIDIIDAQLDHVCINQGNGFWKYQLCYGDNFIQYHDSPKDKDFVNKLGSYSTSPDRAGQSEVTLIFDNEIGYYISEFLEAGDVCDLTGKRREVEIQYVCGLNKESPTIQWVKEIGTCLYEARVMVPDLCQLELFAKNEDKLSATEIVCERSNKDNTKNGIIDIVSDFDPVFLNNEIFLLKPIEEHQEILLLYTGEYKDSSQMETILFEKFGQAFNKVINAKLLKGPNNEDLSLKDSFQWYAPVINAKANYLFTLYLKMLSDGKAELFLKPEENQAPRYNNNFLSFNSNSLDDGHNGGKSSSNKQEKKKKKPGLTLKNGNGDIISVEKVADHMEQDVFVINVVGDDGEPIPMNDLVRSEMLKELFETQNFQDMVEQIRAEDEDGGEKIQFLHHKEEKSKLDKTENKEKNTKKVVSSDNLVRNNHGEDNEHDPNKKRELKDTTSDEKKEEQSGEPNGYIDLTNDIIENASVKQDIPSDHYNDISSSTSVEGAHISSTTIKVRNEEELQSVILKLQNNEPLEDADELTTDSKEVDNEKRKRSLSLEFQKITSSENDIQTETEMDIHKLPIEENCSSVEIENTAKRIIETVTSTNSQMLAENTLPVDDEANLKKTETSSNAVIETTIGKNSIEMNHDEL